MPIQRRMVLLIYFERNHTIDMDMIDAVKYQEAGNVPENKKDFTILNPTSKSK
jgi:hypothetical protein